MTGETAQKRETRQKPELVFGGGSVGVTQENSLTFGEALEVT
jgi:hypothetical protein